MSVLTHTHTHLVEAPRIWFNFARAQISLSTLVTHSYTYEYSHRSVAQRKCDWQSWKTIECGIASNGENEIHFLKWNITPQRQQSNVRKYHKKNVLAGTWNLINSAVLNCEAGMFDTLSFTHTDAIASTWELLFPGCIWRCNFEPLGVFN